MKNRIEYEWNKALGKSAVTVDNNFIGWAFKNNINDTHITFIGPDGLNGFTFQKFAELTAEIKKYYAIA